MTAVAVSVEGRGDAVNNLFRLFDAQRIRRIRSRKSAFGLSRHRRNAPRRKTPKIIRPLGSRGPAAGRRVERDVAERHSPKVFGQVEVSRRSAHEIFRQVRDRLEVFHPVDQQHAQAAFFQPARALPTGRSRPDHHHVVSFHCSLSAGPTVDGLLFRNQCELARRRSSSRAAAPFARAAAIRRRSPRRGRTPARGRGSNCANRPPSPRRPSG